MNKAEIIFFTLAFFITALACLVVWSLAPVVRCFLFFKI